MIDKFRDPVSGLTHLAAAVASVFGLAWLLYTGRADWVKEVAFLVYGLSLILMFSASATYHLVKSEPGVILGLRKFDHSAIYLLIAGSYTPICIFFFTGFWHWGLLTVIWGMALVGIGIKLFVIHAPRWITAGVYLIMGWISIMAVQEILHSLPAQAIAWLIAGGLFYSFGALIYIFKKPNFFPDFFGFHEIWHVFVILGALSHFILIAAYIAV